MDAHYLYRYYNSLCRECISESGKINKHYKASIIHKFRVSVKKLRAFYSLIIFIDKSFKLKNKNLDKIYKSAGKLRSMTLLKKELKNLELYDDKWKVFFKKKIKSSRIQYTSLHSDVNKKLRKDLNNNGDKILKILENCNNIDNFLILYLNTSLNALKHFTASEEGEKIALHNLRKQSKECAYNYELIHKIFSHTPDLVFLKKLNKLNKELGVWHDKIVFRKFILHNLVNELSQKVGEQVKIEILNSEKSILGNVLLLNNYEGTKIKKIL